MINSIRSIAGEQSNARKLVANQMQLYRLNNFENVRCFTPRDAISLPCPTPTCNTRHCTYFGIVLVSTNVNRGIDNILIHPSCSIATVHIFDAPSVSSSSPMHKQHTIFPSGVKRKCICQQKLFIISVEAHCMPPQWLYIAFRTIAHSSGT